MNDRLNEFHDFCLVDLGLSIATAKKHIRQLARFFAFIQSQHPQQPLTRQIIRQYLLTINGNPHRKRQVLASFKRFFRDYLNCDELVSSFKFQRTIQKPKIVPTKNDVQQFFQALPCDDAKTIFLFYATSGLRRNEALQLSLEDIDFKNHMVIPKSQKVSTKQTWITFYNEECSSFLTQYLTRHNPADNRLFQFANRTVNRWFEQTKQKTGINITPHRLREFFCQIMGQLNVADRFVDSFCGRVPRSVLASNYTDYSPQKLKKIYDNAGLKVLASV